MNSLITSDLKVFAKHLNVLVCEDEEDISNEFKSLLSMFFNKVYCAKDGEEGLKYYKKNKCDIVITDLNMPKMDGIELSRQIRIIDKNQVIMVFSGYIDDFVIDLIDIGIQVLMLKPYKLEPFLQKLLLQCENIVLRKEFEKMRLNKTLKNYSKDETSINHNVSNSTIKPKEKITFIDTILDEAIPHKTAENSIDDYMKTFNLDKKIDTTMWKHVSNDIAELNEDYEDCTNKIVLKGFNQELKEEFIRIFSRYQYTLSLLPGLEKFRDIFADLSYTLESLDLNSLDSQLLDVFDMFEFFYEDIMKFFNLVFIENEAKDFNYLTDSLQSSVDQLKMKLGLIEEKDDDLEFF